MPSSMFPEEQAQFDNDLFSTQPFNANPGFLSGSMMAIPKGIATGEAKIGELVGTGLAQTTKMVIQAEQAAAPWSRELGQLDPDQFQHNVDRNSEDFLRATRYDPQTVGTAGQILHTVADVGTRVVGGAAMGGAQLGAITAGATEFAPAKRELESQGIDEHTATQLASAQSVLTGAGALLPGGVGAKAVVRIPSGAAINLTVGAASRYNTHQVLADAGYDQQAAQYRVFDGQSMAADAVLGAFFGFMHSPEDPFPTQRMPQDVVDSGLELLRARQAEVDLAPGIPTTQAARDAHIDTLNNFESALVKGEPLPPIEGTGTGHGEVIDNPAQDALREAATVEQGKATDNAAEGVVASGKRANEPPKTTEQWVRDQINAERAAAEAAKAQERVAEGRPPEEPIDPETQMALDAIDSAITNNPGLREFTYKDPETGETVNAADALEQIREQARGDKDTAMLHEVAAACAGRG
jgi:hypothetical protein